MNWQAVFALQALQEAPKEEIIQGIFQARYHARHFSKPVIVQARYISL